MSAEEAPPGTDLFLIWTGFSGPVPLIGLADRAANGELATDGGGYCRLREPFVYIEALPGKGGAAIEAPNDKIMQIALQPVQHLQALISVPMHVLAMAWRGPITEVQLRKHYFALRMKQRAEGSGLILPGAGPLPKLPSAARHR